MALPIYTDKFTQYAYMKTHELMDGHIDEKEFADGIKQEVFQLEMEAFKDFLESMKEMVDQNMLSKEFAESKVQEELKKLRKFNPAAGGDS